MIGWDGKLRGLDGEGCFDHGGDKATVNVPFYMAVEEPDAWRKMLVVHLVRWWKELIWIVGLEAQHNIALRIYHEGITAHGYAWHGCVVGIVPCVLVGTDDSLKVVAMQMERVLARVVAVEYNLDDLVLLQEEGVGVCTVDRKVGSGGASAKGGI